MKPFVELDIDSAAKPEVPGRLDKAAGAAQGVPGIETEIHALQLEKRLMESLLNALRDGVLCIDRAGTIVYRNPALSEVLVMPAAVGRPIHEVVRSPDLLDFMHGAVGSSDSGGAITADTARAPNQPGETRDFRAGSEFFRATFFPVQMEGERSAELALFVLQNRTDEASVQRLREEFLANAGHELKTPITSIRGYAETMLGRELGEPARGFAEAILRNTLRMGRLVEDMVTISSVESRERRFFPESIVVADLLEATAHLVSGALQQKQQRLRIEVTPDVRVTTDPLLLEHLLLNLIANASRYGPERSDIRVSVAREDAARFRIQVADQGSGVPDEFRTKIFERFFRVDRDRARHEGGTGLGLSIVRQIARLHGGRVWVGDAPEGGALFQVILRDLPQ